jgi:Protein of unknown function (DUF3098)
MAKQQQPQRPAPKTSAEQAKKAAPAPAQPRRTVEKRDSIFASGSRDMIFGRENFILFGAGLGLVLLGLVLMMGGAQPDPNTWDPNTIYSSRRITLAPILIIAGFVVTGYGIFKKGNAAPTSGAEQ